jgi:serine/threonine protein kinase
MVIILEGLAVKKVFNKNDGFGI